MIFESWARALLVLHAVLAGVLLGASTHQLLWCRHYLRGRFPRVEAERRTAQVTGVAFALSFVVGAALYPTYKVRVRVEYFDSSAAIAEESRLREAHHTITPPSSRVPSVAASMGPRAADLGWVSRLFDVKEHWVALGAGAAILLALLARFAHPRDLPEATHAYVGLALFVFAMPPRRHHQWAMNCSPS